MPERTIQCVGTLTVILSSGEHVEYRNEGDQIVGVQFGVKREGWISVFRHDPRNQTRQTLAFYPRGGWIGVQSDDGIPEASKSHGFQGPVSEP